MPWINFAELCKKCAKRHRKTGKRGPKRRIDPAEVRRLARTMSAQEIADKLGCNVRTVFRALVT
jgi:hypothetical protein